MKQPIARKGMIFLIFMLALIPAALADMDLSAESGFFAEPFHLEMEADKKNAVIYYTLDGSAPGENSLRYEGPVFLDYTTEKYDPLSQITGVNAEDNFIPQRDFPSAHVVRARALLPDGTWTDETCGTYFIGYDRKELYGDLPVISLMTDADGLFDYETGIYMLGKTFEEWNAAQTAPYEGWQVNGNFTNRGKEWERETMVDFMMGEGRNDHFSQLMGMRVKGASSRTATQKSLKLFAREEYGEKNVTYPLFPDNFREFDGELLRKYKTFTLRNGGTDRDYGRIRDPFIQNLSEGLDFETSANRPVIAFLNGEFWGLYTLHEEYSDNYLQYHYAIDNENVGSMKFYNVEFGEDIYKTLYYDMQIYIRYNDMSKPELYEKACTMLDMRSYADYAAVQIYIYNKDGLFRNNNWQLWRTRYPEKEESNFADSKWRMMLYDTDFSAGIYDQGLNYTDNYLKEVYHKQYEEYHVSLLFPRLLKNEEFKQLFVTSMCDVRNLYFDKDRVKALHEKMYAEYAPYVPDTLARFGPSWILEGDYENYEDYFADTASYILTFFEGRYEVMPDHLKEVFNLSDPKTITIRISDPEKGKIYVNGRELPVRDGQQLCYFPEYPLKLEAVANDGASFAGWEADSADAARIEHPEKWELTLHFTDSFTLTANFR